MRIVRLRSDTPNYWIDAFSFKDYLDQHGHIIRLLVLVFYIILRRLTLNFLNSDMEDNIKIHPNVRFGQNAVMTGTVKIGEYSSIWHNVVLRGDVAPITIGSFCNIQDGTVMHGQLDEWDTQLGNYVSIGHSCLLHGCHLADHSFIGMGSIVMNGSFIGENVLVAAGSLISEGSTFDEPNVLVMGRPGKVVRPLRDKEIQIIRDTPERYMKYAQQWLSKY
jgi:gamma-carbonic anhydrase